MNKHLHAVPFTALLLVPIECIARPTPADMLRNSGNLTLSKPSPDLCRAVANRNDLMPCADNGYADTLSIEFRSQGLYSVHIERREASVAYDVESRKGYVSPSYCSFGGRGNLSGSQLSITDNEDQDGEPVEGFKIVLEEESVVITATGVHAQRYCGAGASWNGLTFHLYAQRAKKK